MLNTSMFKGEAQQSITFPNEEGGYALFNKIKDMLIAEIQYQNIPATFFETQVKSGGMFGTKLPILVISHPTYHNDYFSLCVMVNGQTVSFPLTGESKENTKANKKEFYTQNGNYIKASFCNPDEFKLQQEVDWEASILRCFNSLVS